MRRNYQQRIRRIWLIGISQKIPLEKEVPNQSRYRVCSTLVPAKYFAVRLRFSGIKVHRYDVDVDCKMNLPLLVEEPFITFPLSAKRLETLYMLIVWMLGLRMARHLHIPPAIWFESGDSTLASSDSDLREQQASTRFPIVKRRDF
jgi:hypothetical protein